MLDAQTLRGACAVVADDDPSVQQALARVLRAAGAEVRVAPDGAVALDLCRARCPDLVVLDLDMPVLAGIDACRALRQDPATRDAGVLMLTGATPSREVEALEAGADDFLAKPPSPWVLAARCSTIVRRVVAERENRRLITLLRQHLPVPVRDGGGREGVIEEVRAALMFTDLRGFTATASVCDPIELFQAIDVLAAAQVERVFDAGGYVDKFTGDGLLAVFEGEGACDRACDAAASIVAWARTHDAIAFWRPPPLGIGIHTGLVLRGELGGARQREYAVIGHTVNTAARLCGIAGALEVIVSEGARAAAHRHDFGPARTVALRGLAPMAAYALVA